MITKLKYDEFHYIKAYIYLKVETAFLKCKFWKSFPQFDFILGNFLSCFKEIFMLWNKKDMYANKKMSI